MTSRATFGDLADLALWTGRLAYADPTWTLATGPAGDHRPPQQLGPDPDTFTCTLAAVHQAANTLTTLAAADYTQIWTAARSGRLLVPAAQVPELARTGCLCAQAPRRHAKDLLTAYRNVGISSVKATAKIAAVTADHQAPARRSATSSSSRPASGRTAPGATIAITELDSLPGPIERILFDLGISDAELLSRGRMLDNAASQIIAEAADQTAPQRWHSAVVRPSGVSNTTAVARNVLAADLRRPSVKLQTPLRSQGVGTSAQPEALQAEP